METKIVCYANEKDCQCVVDVRKTDPQLQHQIFEAIYGQFNRISYVKMFDGLILIKNIEGCTPHHNSADIELAVNMCQDILLNSSSISKDSMWGQCPDDQDFGFTVIW